MKFTNTIWWVWLISYISSTVFAGNHLVLLKQSQTVEKFMRYDFTFPVAQRFVRLINKFYKIGDLVGFSGSFSKTALERLSRCPLVSEIAADIDFEAFALIEQDPAPAHLAQLSSEDWRGPRSRAYYYDDTAQGEDVNVYILDTGLECTSEEFDGRASVIKDLTGEGIYDYNGHGTHVAGLVGSATYGVAKKATLVGVKTLDKAGHGSLSSIMAAIEFAVDHRRESGRPGVANLSLGAVASTLLNRVIDSAAQTGLVIVVAAGNHNIDACQMSPASAHSAITVGAADPRARTIAEFSNWGPCVDLFTSGVDVASIDTRDPGGSQRLSGTSMASPIVAGLVANLLSSGVHVWEVKDRLLAMARRGELEDPRSRGLRWGSPNLVAYNGCDPASFYNDSEDEWEDLD